MITGLTAIAGRPAVVVANDATVKAGSWWPETIRKILRAQEIAMRCRIPIIYLVDSSGVNLPYQGGVFPGQYGASRIFYYNSIMRRYLKVPQIAAVMGPCIAGGAYLALGLSNGFAENMTAGRGFIALAALIFGKWRPVQTLLACLLFGFTEAVSNQMQGVVKLPSGEDIPVQFIQMVPYVLTIVVLAGFIGSSRPPRALGIPYQKEK